MASDYLKECMSDVGQGPLDIFQKAFCSVCANRDCTRSAANGMAFDRRILNWKNDLFDSVPRADEADPKFDGIRSKKFLPIVPGSVNVSMWSPPAAEAPVEVPKPLIHFAVESKPISIQEAPTEAAVVPQKAPSEPLPVAKPVQGALNPGNTPFTQGTVLPGYTAPKPTEDIILESGGTFTLGGEDE